MRENIISLCRRVSEKAEGMIVTSQVNRRYVTGFPSSDGFVVIRGEKITYVTDSRYYESACIKQKNGDIDADINILPRTGGVMSQLNELLSGCKTVLFEDKAVSYDEYISFLNGLEARLERGGSDIFNVCRAVKTPDELEKIKKAQAVTDKTFEYILKYISDNLGKKGFTEKALRLEMDYFMLKNGADGLAFDTIAVSGSKSSLPHGVPEDTPIVEGFLTMDFGAAFDGYCSDMTRTVCVGTPSDDMKRVYDTVLAAQRTALEGIRGGIMSQKADFYARDVIDRAGFKGTFGHSLGHSLGLEIHETPTFSPSSKQIVPSGAVLSVEPGIYLEGRYGVRIEDIVLLTPDGNENLTKSPKELIVL